MPGGARIGDKAKAVCVHGCKVCAHKVSGPAVQGEPSVIFNDEPAVRKGDSGIHGFCCGTNTWYAASGAKTVWIGDKPAYRQKDKSAHCGGTGQQVDGSSDITIGNSQAPGFKKAARNHTPFVCNCNQ